MNARFVLAQDIAPVAAESTFATPRLIKLSKPQGNQAVSIHLDGTVKIDFSDVAGEKITLVHVGDRLVILFDNQSTVTLDPFYGPNGEPLQDISVHLGPDRDVSGIDFATLFPVTTDQSVLPAAGGNSPLSGANFAATPTVDALSIGQPLALLNGEGQGGANFGNSSGPDHVNHVPVAVEDSGFVIEAGVKPGNTPFAGSAFAAGNVLANDTDADIGDIKLVIGVVAGAAAKAIGQVGATLSGIYGQLTLNADGSWTYALDNANAATQALAQGAHGRDIFTYTMRDAASETSTTTLTLDVLGTNDAPVIVSGPAAMAFGEQAGQTGAELVHQAHGTLDFSDVDVPDGHTVAVALASAQWSGGVAIPAPTLAQATAALIAAVASETAGGTGAIDWNFGLRDAALDFLGAGETLVLNYQVTVTDDNLATAMQTVTITVTGSNDAPQIAAGVSAGVAEQAEITGSSVADSVQGTLAFIDVDLDDVGHTASVTGVASSGVTHGLAPDATTLQGFLHVDSTTKAVAGDSGSVGWTFSAPDQTFDYLAANETLTLTYTVQVDDHDGGTAQNTVTITVTGANDAPRIAAGVTAGVAEQADTLASFDPDSVSGTLAFTDVDLNDVGHTAAVTAVVPSGVTGGLAPDADTLRDFLHIDATTKASGSGSGSVAWTFSAADSTFDYLAANETLTLTYTVQVDDHDGGTAENTVTITVTGSNDAPRIEVGVTAGVDEQAGTTGSSDADSVQGTLAFTDVDLDDTGHTAAVTAVVSSGVTTGLAPDSAMLRDFLHVDSTTKIAGSGSGSVGWTFSAPDDTFDYLAENETLILTYTVKVDDHDGGTAENTVTVTVNGANDKVMITAANAGGAVNEEEPVVNLVANGGFEVDGFNHWDASDINTVVPFSVFQHSGDVAALFFGSASLAQSITTEAGQHYTLDFWFADYNAGTLNVTWNGNSVGSFTLGGSYGYQEYTVDVVGTNGASDLVFSLNTPEDSPTFLLDDVSFALTDPVRKTGGSISFSDADLRDIHSASFVAENGALHSDGTAYLGSFSLSPVTEANGAGALQWHFEAKRSELQFLAAGQTYQQFYDVTIADSHGGDVVQTVAVTITGTNDAPVLEASAPTLPRIAENDLSPAGTTVASLLGHHVTDVDAGAVQGIAITGTTGGFFGTWQYSTDGGAHWSDFDGYSTGSALLLAATDLVRYAPQDVFEETAAFSFVAWDQTSGAHGMTADVSVRGDATAFSVRSDTASITVTQTNHAPTPENDSATTREDTPLTVNAGNGVLANDYDIDMYSSLGDTIVVVAGTFATAKGGNITFQADGSYVYTPGQDYNGQDSVDYTVQDLAGATATATLFINVTPVNDTPLITMASHTIIVDEDAAPFSVSYTATPGPANESAQHVAAPVTVVTDPSGVLAGWSVVNGSYSFSLKANAYGTVTVSFTVKDDGGTANGGHDTSATETFTITVNSVNDAPVAVDDRAAALQDTPLTVTAANGVLVNDTDADIGDTKTVTTGTVITAHGSITFQADGGYTYTPNQGFTGTDAVDYTVRDAAGTTDTGTLVITVAPVNHAPVISGLDNTSVAEDGVGVLIDTFAVSDVDSASGLTFRVLNESNAVDSRFVVVPASGTTAGQPGTYELRLAAGVSFNYQAENADGTPTVVLKVEVNDHGNVDNLATAPITITVTHVNHAPVAHDDTLNFATGPQTDLTGWTLDTANGHYYKVVAANLTWSQAAAAATAAGGYLATITGPAENSFILGLMSPGQAFFIGASDAQTEATWKWVTGPEAGAIFWQGAGNGGAVGGAYAPWRAGEPNDTNGGEDFGTIQSDNGGWNDVGANVTSGYVMEYTLPPPEQRGILENASKTFSAGLLLANDTDIDGDLLSIQSVSATSAKGATVSYDANTQQVTYNAATSSQLAALTFGQSTADTFTYTITDGHGGTSTATATVTVVGKNDAPVIGAPGAGQVIEDFDLTAVQGERVINGNFETLTLTGWTTSGVDPLYTGLVTAGGSAAYSMYTHNTTVPTTLSQVVQTTAGVTYDIKFSMNHAFSVGSTSVTVYWDGVAYLAFPSIPASGSYDNFTQYSFRALASSASTTFQISTVSPSTSVDFDNISVIAATSETTTGTIGFTDTELADTHTVSVTPQATGYVGTFDAKITNVATGDGVGQVAWLYNVENSQIQYLAAGTSVQQVYTVYITDSSGNVSHQDVTVTIKGTNDAPVVSTSAQTVNLTEDASSTGNLIVNPGFETGTSGPPATFTGWVSTGNPLYHLTLLPSSGSYAADIIPGGLVTLSQTVAVTAGTHYALDFALFNYAYASAGTFSVSWVDANNVTHQLDSFSNRAVGTYNSSTGAYSYGQFSYDILSNGPSITVVFALNGTSVQWQLDDVSLTREETASGTLSFTDIDLTDTHTVSVVPGSNIGSFTATLGADSTNGAAGAVNWSYAVDDAAIQYLGAADTLTQTYTVRIDDNHGGFTTQNVTVVTHGVNDAASITGTAAAMVTEDGTTTVNGTLTVRDVDTGQNHFQTPASLAGTYGSFTFNALTGAWGYTLNNTAANVQALSGTDVKHDTLTVTSLDGTASQIIDVTINGNNDAPVVAGETILLGGYGGAPASAASTPVVPEVENNSSASPQLIDRTAFAIASNANLGDASLPSITITGSISTSADKDFFKIFLKAGETITLDVDNTTGGLDTFLLLRPNPTGSSGSNNNNDSATTLGGAGSTSGKDSYLTFTASSSAFYYIDLECNTASGASSSGGYQLQASIGGFIPDPTGTSKISVADLLANDTDVDGDVLSITNVSGSGVTLVDGGTAVQVQAGVTSFTYTVSDGHVTRTATANVTESAAGYTITGTSANELLIGSSSADVLSGGSGGDTLDGGKGADTLTGGGGIDKFVFNPGDSALTVTGSGGSGVISGYDTITDFTISSEKIDFAVAPIAPAVTTDFADSTLTAAGLTVTNHAITNGVITFRNGSTNLSLASMSDVAAAVQYLRGGDLGDAGATVAFTATISGVIHTFLYQQVGNTPSSTDDLLVDLGNVNISNLSALIGTGNRIDPIVLDLGHDGIGFSSLENGVAFDIDGDGVKAHIAWTSGNDGILAIDLDGSGRIENGTEIFSPSFAGGHFADGLAALATLDSNHDGKIDSADTAFAKLLVWQDFNHNGVSDAGELTSLTDHDIASILLSVTPGNSQIDGQAIAANGTFTNTDGTTGNFVEVAFDVLDGGANGALHFTDAVHLSDADLAGHSGITALQLGDFANSVTLGDTANEMIGSGTLTIDGTAATSASSALTVDGSGLGPSTHLHVLGGTGNDSLTGGAGDDTIAGGKGNDTLKGGGGADIFAFAESGAGHVDTILDYSAGQGDRIDLSALLDGHAGAGSNPGDFVRLTNAGSNVIVQVDTDGAANGARWSDVAMLQDYHAAGNQVLVQFEQQVHQLSVAA